MSSFTASTAGLGTSEPPDVPRSSQGIEEEAPPDSVATGTLP